MFKGHHSKLYKGRVIYDNERGILSAFRICPSFNAQTTTEVYKAIHSRCGGFFLRAIKIY